MPGIDSSFSSHEHQGLVSPHLLTLLPSHPVLGLFRVFLKLFLKPPPASKPSLAREAELHFSSDPGQIVVHCLIPAWRGPEVAQQHLGGSLATPRGF